MIFISWTLAPSMHLPRMGLAEELVADALKHEQEMETHLTQARQYDNLPVRINPLTDTQGYQRMNSIPAGGLLRTFGRRQT